MTHNPGMRAEQTQQRNRPDQGYIRKILSRPGVFRKF